MIPTDLVARLKLLTESTIQPLAPVRGLPSDLPPFTPGQRFTARIESALPNGTFQAQVGGRSLTLLLPRAASEGDLLNLVVVDRAPRHVVARLDEPPTAAPGAVLSRAGQLIASVLNSAAGTQQPALLHAGNPILAAPPGGGAELVPLLRHALVESGVFYESHQAQWASGRLPLESLLREPQGRHSSRAANDDAVRIPAPAATQKAPSSQVAEDPAASGLEKPLQISGAAPATTMPADLTPVVQQQLDAAGNHQLAWQGLLWPGQPFEWRIDDPFKDADGDAAAPADVVRPWTTSLRLTLPALGCVEAQLVLTPTGVAVSITAGETETAARLRGERDSLAESLAAAGVPLLTFAAAHHGHA
jgi:hypothetical protein